MPMAAPHSEPSVPPPPSRRALQPNRFVMALVLLLHSARIAKPLRRRPSHMLARRR